MSPRLHLSDVHKTFGPKQVLRGVNLSIEKGQSLVVIGGSGSGKSVMLKSVLGLLRPERGSIKIDGQETIGLSREARRDIDDKIGMLFQNSALFDSLPVWRNVAFQGLQNDGLSVDDARQLAVESLALVDLGPELLDLFPASLSGGMQKRVGLARAIAAKPQIIFFDEPTTGLHFEDIRQLLEVLHRLRDGGNTVVIIEHNLDVIKTADWVIDLGPEGGSGGGQIIATGTPEDVAAEKASHTGRFWLNCLRSSAPERPPRIAPRPRE